MLKEYYLIVSYNMEKFEYLICTLLLIIYILLLVHKVFTIHSIKNNKLYFKIFILSFYEVKNKDCFVALLIV
jgi:hypothetical protein